MTGITRTNYGSPDVLELREVDRPEPADDEMLLSERHARGKVVVTL